MLNCDLKRNGVTRVCFRDTPFRRNGAGNTQIRYRCTSAQSHRGRSLKFQIATASVEVANQPIDGRGGQVLGRRERQSAAVN